MPLVYHVSEEEILGWTGEKAFRRYELALQRLGAKQKG